MMNNINDTEIMEFRKRFENIKMKELMLTEKEKSSPDTYGCDCIFLEGFINGNMDVDFKMIARDFLKHEMENLKDYGEVKYLNDEFEGNHPDVAMQNMILNLMMGAVRSGSAFAKAQMCYLYKQYYKREYKQLKRFQELSGMDVFTIADNGSEALSAYDMARVLTMAEFLGIQIKESCNFIYLYMTDEWNRTSDEGEGMDYDLLEEELNKASIQLKDWFETEKDMKNDSKRMDRFIRKALEYYGICEDYIDWYNFEFYGYEREYSKAVALFKEAFPNEEIKKEEVATYVTILRCLGTFCGFGNRISNIIGVTLGIKEGEFYEDENFSLYHPDEVELKENNKPEIKKEEKMVCEPTQKLSETAEQNYLVEIEQLKRKLRNQESENQEFRARLSEINKSLLEQKRLNEQYKDEHKELVALRSHVYHSTEYENSVEKMNISKMKDAIAGCKITMIGGNDNWVRKLKQEFPNWNFVSPNVSGSISSKHVVNADKVYFFTDTMSHSTYNKYIQVVREHDVPFGYIHGVNIEANIVQIYQEIYE